MADPPLSTLYYGGAAPPSMAGPFSFEYTTICIFSHYSQTY
ncbi:hypothetical protein CCACVL1_23696 [Corchorus capsularis]|uniref:Uncharacterized protein n=1 Tax=Corchorus capsularis TaxID=210143 RepID=A0A1R3GST6_COCAP|nr:hypothetical protein CCACVL1_23696 [Corchorus capsularis]